MDKYEFNLKVEQIKKLVSEGDYQTALKVVDSIDWSRVRNVNLLTLAASVYEENGYLEKAKDNLVMALERAPVGKRILYKLTELSVRSGNVEEAEDYYHEYNALAPDDPQCLLLQYMIMKVQHVPYPQLIQCLELYNQYEPDEKWMYELATTYESAGQINDMLALCDRIALMFGASTYGVKALKLKQKYTQLTEQQRALLYPNSIANAGVHYAGAREEENPQPEEEISGNVGDMLSEDRIENEDAIFAAYVRANDPVVMEMQRKQREKAEEAERLEEEALARAEAKAAEAAEEAPEESPEEVPEDAFGEVEEAFEEAGEELPETFGQEVPAEGDPEIPAEETAEEAADENMTEPETAASELPEETYPEPVFHAENVGGFPEFSGRTPDPDAESLLQDARIAAAKLAPEPQPERPRPQARTSFTPAEPKKPAPAPLKKPVVFPAFRLMIEAEDDQEGLDIAVEELKLLHAERGLSNGAIKTAAEKLNEKGFTAQAAAKIRGKDFVIEHCGEMDRETAEEVLSFVQEDDRTTNIILIDNPEGMDKLEENCPGFFDLFEYLTDEEAREKDYTPHPPKEVPYAQTSEEEDYEEDEKELEPAGEEKPKKASRSFNADFVPPVNDNDLMNMDDFAQYCVQYATEIDCTITGKAMLALYETIEKMEQDGVPLTKKEAEDLIEETADRAEKPPIGKRISGLFHSKYDKDGLLILKEEDFIY